MRRVVITGMGALSSLGSNSSVIFERLIQGCTGIRQHPLKELPTAVGYVDFNPNEHFSKMQLMGLDRTSQLALVAAEQATQQAQAKGDGVNQAEMGVFWGTGAGGCESTEHAYAKFFGAGGEQKKLLTVPAAMFHAPAAQIGMCYGIRGECQTYSTACSSAAVAIGEAFRRVKDGYRLIALADGSDCPLLPGFLICKKKLKNKLRKLLI